MNFGLPLSAVMTTNPVTVTSEQKLVDVKHIYENKKFHHHIPVINAEGHPIGIVELAGFIRALGSASLDDSESVYNTTTVGEIMTKDYVKADAHMTIKAAAEAFYKNDVNAIFVLKEGKLTGIVTPFDLVKLMAGY